MVELSEQIRLYFDATTQPVAAPRRVDDGRTSAPTAAGITSGVSPGDPFEVGFVALETDEWAEEAAPKGSGHSFRRRTWSLVAAAIIIPLVAVGGLIALERDNDAGRRTVDDPAPDPQATQPLQADDIEVARRFLVAYGAGHIDAALDQLATDADVSGLTGRTGTRQDLVSFWSWLDAAGYQQRVTGCEERVVSATGSEVRCLFEFEMLGSDALGLGPFQGSFFDVTINNDEVVAASRHWELEDFSPQVWEPFADWMVAHYPGDVATMYTDESVSEAATIDRSIRLWRTRSREWAASITGVDPVSADLLVGRRSMTVDGMSFTIEVPGSGWEPYEGFLLSKSTHGPQGAEGVVFWSAFPDGDKADPCYGTSWPPPATISGIAAELSTAPGVELRSDPSATTIDGHGAEHVALTVGEDLGCEPGFFYNWKTQTEGAMWVEVQAGDTIDVWLVDVGGTTLFIGAEIHADGYSDQLVGEIETIISSMKFE
jgi:hypothetical protein